MDKAIRMTEFIYCNFSDENKLKFDNLLKSTCWENVFEASGTQEAYSNFDQTFTKQFNEAFPLKTTKCNRACDPMSPWITSRLLIARKQK